MKTKITRIEKHYFKDWLNWLGLFFIICFCFRSFIAHSGPIYYQGNFGEYVDVNYPDGQWALIPYDGTEIALAERFNKPLSRSSDGRIHLLGTDALGRDVAGGLVYAFRRSLVISLFSMTFALIIGLLLGISAAWFGNKLRLNILSFIFFMFAICYLAYLLYYANYLSSSLLGLSVFGIITIGMLIRLVTRRLTIININIPWDSVVLRLLEIFRSVPTLVLILAISPLFLTSSILGFSLLISLFTWPIFTRLARAETMKIQSEDFIHYVKSSGYSTARISLMHILPNIRKALLIAFCFGVAAVIVFESSLSFLGVGPFMDEPSLGGMLKESRNHWKAWWLSVFPGLIIFLMVLFFREIVARLEKER